MNHPSNILAWVNCYGAWAPGLRHPVETIGYDQYLEGVASALAALKDQIEAVYVSGGLRDQHGRTECETTIPELQRRLEAKDTPDLKLVADEASITSITIARTFLDTWQTKYPGHTPILFCDQVRSETNAYALECLAKKAGYDLPPLSEVLVPIPRLDNHPNSTPEKQAEKLKYMREKGIEEVEKMEIEARQNRLL